MNYQNKNGGRNIMNIFKILSSNDGSINEPNVSSFLAYLLDSNENHGFDSKFLEMVLSEILTSDKKFFKELIYNERVRDLSKKSSFEIRVQPEFSVYSTIERKEKRRDIDILIEIYKDSESKVPLYSFCIENKINDGAIHNGSEQLFEEVMGLKKYYESLSENTQPSISMIFLTPKYSKKAVQEYKEFERKINETQINIKYHHMIWEKSEENKESSIYSILSELLKKEIIGEIEPIYEYTKHTIKGFMTFISSDFKSYKEEKIVQYERRIYNNPPLYYLHRAYEILEFNQDIQWDEVLKLTKEEAKKQGDILKDTTLDKKTVINEKNRKNFHITNPLDKQKNLFYYPDVKNKKVVRKLDLNNPPDNINIYWKDTEAENNLGECLITEFYPEIN